MVVGAVNRDSIRQALVAGITAEQIITYLRQHAHPSLVVDGAPAVPIAVAEQITLWARERARVQCSRAALYTLPNDRLFTDALAIVESRGELLYSNADKRALVVSRGSGEAT